MTATEAHPRLAPREVKKLVPDLYPAVSAVTASAKAAGLEPELIELVYLRSSQLNGCAYCIDMHTDALREMGVSQKKIDLAIAWEEAGIFSDREAAALAWAETLTLIAHDHVPLAKYEAVHAVFSELEVAGLTAAIAGINVWNRIAVTYRYVPGT
jgi:AhpD family alkylhydroperoxidase